MKILKVQLVAWAFLVMASFMSTSGAQAQTVANDCNLLEYFQYIFNSPSRPHNCTNVPPEFWVYQTQVGEVSSSGKSAGSSALAGNAAGAVSAAGVASTMLTPSASLMSGAFPLAYNASNKEAEGQKQINSEMDGYAEEDALPSLDLERGIWVKSIGSMGRKRSTEQNASAKISSAGVMAGTDIWSNEFFRFGVLGAFSQVSVDVNENNNELDIIMGKAGATATLEVGSWYLDGMGTVSRENYDTYRTVDIDGNGDLRPMWSNYTNHRITAAFETGYRFAIKRLVVRPLAGVTMNWLYQDRVREKGNLTASVITDKNTIITGTTRLGLNLSTAFLFDNISIVPTVGGNWTYRFGELKNANRISTTQGVTYEYVGEAPLRHVANLYAGLTANIDEQMAVSASYASSFNRDEINHVGSLGLRLRF